MVLAELRRSVAETLHHGGDSDVGHLPAFLSARHADLGHAGAYRHVTADECGAPGGAALLAVVIGERQTFPCKAVNVGRLVTHHTAIVVADVPGADVITPDDENVGLFALVSGNRMACVKK
ncbi:MAG: hypothetical protein BROFUL_01941 [Candidatus Brocadia fulgida]|uniref:Uncharacterized protein n=1 Tax=Candidatus Brocadia fulgida TaxID=380242 RepID=A0A0M2UU41_9BACT|nr:MAG: hypothetical protein BROFUL_01941 [Candidatus Brocadia fulgida]